ncbi:MAG: hypothetical protein M3071_15040 [Actinomycetota bacterium]|nr:hypothetical protein [Actinomycetota bacterium]
MSRRSLALVPVVAALTLAAPVLADTTKSVTATGTSEFKVVPTNRHSNASIAAAVAIAQKLAVPGALSQAHANALLYAHDAGLTLGLVLSVSDAQTGAFYGPYGPGAFIGPFGPGKYCGTERRPVIKRTGSRIKVIRVRKFHTCYVPRYASATLTVTYSAS